MMGFGRGSFWSFSLVELIWVWVVCVVDGGDCVVMADGLWLVVVELWRWLFFPLFFFFLVVVVG